MNPITTVEQYKAKWPNETRAVQLIGNGPNGEVHIEYFEGNFDTGLVGRFITSFVFVNGWTASAKEITL